MDFSLVAESIPVHNTQPLRLQNGYGRRITVLAGNVWVTQDGDPRDIVLSAGDDFRFDRPGPAIVSALDGDAQIAREDGVVIGSGGRRRAGRIGAAVSKFWANLRNAIAA